MQIPFKKVSQTGLDFETRIDDVAFSGKLYKKDKYLVECEGNISGSIEHACDICAKDMSLQIDEKVVLFFHDGVCEDQPDSLDVIEFFTGKIDLDEVLESEIASIKSGYFHCSTCKA